MPRFLCCLLIAAAILIIPAGCGGGANRTPGIVTGTLTYAGTATAPAAASITLAQPAGTVAYADGVYTIDNVPPGSYVLTAETDGCGSVSVAVIVTPGGTATRDIEFVSNTGLLAYYPFAGNADDASGLNNHAISVNAIPAADLLGRGGNAYQFNGDGYYITIPGLWDNPSDLTVAAWAKAARIPDPETERSFYILAHQDGGWLTMDIGTYWCDATAIAMHEGQPISFTASTPSTGATDWRHMAVVYSKGKFLRLYLDGALVDTENLNDLPGGAENLYDNNYTCFIGSDNGLNYEFNGSIGEVRVYNRVLNDAEIAALAQR